MTSKQTQKREAIQTEITDKIRMAVVKELVDGGCQIFKSGYEFLYYSIYHYQINNCRRIDGIEAIFRSSDFPEAYAKFLELTK